MRLQGKVALVTGGDSGIGKGIAKQLGIDGADVYIFGRSQRKLQKAVKEFRKEGLGIKAVKGNVSSLEDGKKALSHIISKSGKLNILVNSAGIISQGGILDGKTRDWEKTLQINLHGVYLFTKIMIPELIKNKGNCIVNISSVCSKRVAPTLLAYSVSKAALDMFSKCLALELAPYLVRVNTVNPGMVISDLHATGGIVKSKEEYSIFLKKMKKLHPLGRIGTPKDIANLVSFLISDEASWITGASICIDGGRALLWPR